MRPPRAGSYAGPNRIKRRATFRAALPALVAAAALLAPAPADGQQDPVQLYLRAVADHFDLPASEVRVLSEWRIGPEEVPVALFISREAGISADALLVRKRGGRGWGEISRQHGLGADVFHVPLPPGTPAGPLTPVYESFRATPTSGWGSLVLEDEALIQLVNLHVLSEYLRTPPDRVLQAWGEAGSFVDAYVALLRAGG